MIIGIILLFVLGRFFYRLAEEYDKNKWLYAILGVITYYGGTFIYGVIYGLFYYSNDPLAIDSVLRTDWVFIITTILVGIGFAYGLYYLLERSWRKDKKEETESINIDDIGKN